MYNTTKCARITMGMLEMDPINRKRTWFLTYCDAD